MPWPHRLSSPASRAIWCLDTLVDHSMDATGSVVLFDLLFSPALECRVDEIPLGFGVVLIQWSDEAFRFKITDDALMEKTC